jgi:uncharacterized repeat protein (TIGR01451 family)
LYGAVFFVIVVLNCRAQTAVLTQHNDNARSGLNSNETILTTSNVNAAQFGKLFSVQVDGQVFAQPLYVPNVTFPGNVTHNVLVVATENDSVYAFDADGAGTNPLWQASLVDAAHGANPGEIPFDPLSTLGCKDLLPEVGVTGTPVIDVTTTPPTIYVVAKSMNGFTFFQRLHALDSTSGNEEPQGPAVISASVNGTGDGSQNGILPFDALEQLNRAGLLLLNGVVYVGFSSHCDLSPFHGWIFAYNGASLTQQSVFVTTPNGGLGGIWLGGSGLAADSNGYIYVASGNGNFDTSAPVTDFGDTLLKLSTIDGNGNDGQLSVADYFTPFDQEIMFDNDADLGSGGALLLPDQPGNYPHLLAQAGKEGRIYLVDRDQMTSDPSNPSQPESYCSSCTTDDPQIVEESVEGYIGGVFGMPAYWNNSLYFWPANDPLTSIPISNGLPNFASPTVGAFSPGFPGAVPSISSNGNAPGTAIVWAITSLGIYAYNAQDLSQVLWTSTQAPNDRDQAGPWVKFSTPTIANGKLYVGTGSEIDVYGLLPSVTPSAVTLQQGQTQQFSATMPGPIWSISPVGAGSISSTGLYAAPASITASQTVTVTASVPGESPTATITLVPTGAATSATLVRLDGTTQGNWIGVYGADGYSLANSSQSLPTYDEAFAVRNQSNWTWAASTADPRALQIPGGGRIAATWYSPTTFSLDVNITDAELHQIALYLLDWDAQGRTETLQISDASPSQLGLLAQQSVSNFTGGIYVVYSISGHVTITVTSNAGPNAVVGGVFFGGAAATSITPSSSADFTGFDAATQGNWIGTYGADGYSVAPSFQSAPAYGSFALQNESSWTWAATTADPRALQIPGGGRIAATSYNPSSLSLNINFTDANSHQVALYAVDWDGQGRAETLQVLDASTHAQLDEESISGFENGIYVIWSISGSVQIVIRATAGPNAVLSGIFFDGVWSSSTPILSITKTHSGDFTLGQQNATYTITVSNAAHTVPTSGMVTVTETLPSGLALVSMAGTGWTCPVGTNSCTRSDALSEGTSYPAITATVNVSSSATSPQANQVSVSGGGSTAASATDSTIILASGAAFVTADTQTGGSWQGVYGADGYALANVTPQNVPSYATFAVQNQANWTWAAATTDRRAVQIPGGSGGIAAAWYNNPSFSFDLNVGSAPHQVAIYAVDWDSKGRSETIQILDASTNLPLDTETTNNFTSGVYLVWNITGHVTISVTSNAGPNAVVSGVFF